MNNFKPHDFASTTTIKSDLHFKAQDSNQSGKKNALLTISKLFQIVVLEQ